MLTSVVIPSFNEGDKLRLTVESLLLNTTGPVEIIVVDNGSTDHSSDFLLGDHDPRVTLVHSEERLGVVGARHAGTTTRRASCSRWNRPVAGCSSRGTSSGMRCVASWLRVSSGATCSSHRITAAARAFRPTSPASPVPRGCSSAAAATVPGPRSDARTCTRPLHRRPPPWASRSRS
ncbi:MAG: glycosyltransferase family 2 protein [Planctomycetaceae bacterium]